MLTTCFAIKDHNINLCFSVLNDRTWCLLDGICGTLVQMLTPTPEVFQTVVCLLHAVPALSDTRIAGVSQSWMLAAKQGGISEILADLVPLTAEAPNIASPSGTKLTGAWTLTGW